MFMLRRHDTFIVCLVSNSNEDQDSQICDDLAWGSVMKKTWIMIVSIATVGLWSLQAMALPARGEFMREIRRLSVELQMDTQDLLRDAREYGYRRGQGREFNGSRRGGDGRYDRRGDGGESRREDAIETQRAIRDMKVLADQTRDFNNDVERYFQNPANTERSFRATAAAYDAVLKSFGDASILDRANVKESVLRVIKDMALLRFYYDIADGDWSPDKIQRLAKHLQGAADRLANASSFREGDLRMAAREFARQARRIGSRGFSRSEDGFDDFRELRRTYENLEGRLRNSNFPDDVVGDALQAFDDFQVLATYYELFPKYRRPGRWTYRDAISLADTIVRKADGLRSNLSRSRQWRDRERKDAYNTIVDVSEAARAFRRELANRNQSMRDTLQLVQRLEEKSEDCKRILRGTRYFDELMEIDRDIDKLADLYEYRRGSGRGGMNRDNRNDRDWNNGGDRERNRF
jgi:hypothetical protein